MRHPSHVAGLLSLALLAACTGSRPAGALVLAVDAPPETLDRRMALSATAMRACQLVTPGLTRIDATGAAVADLAESFQEVDPLTWRFELRPGLTFSDGTPLTAGDVVATYLSVLDPALGSPHRGGYAYLLGVEAAGQGTVLFHLRRPFGALPVDATLGILPAALTAPAMAEKVRRAPVGAGPYVVASWKGDEELVLAPSSRWYGTPPTQPLEIRTVRDETTRVLELRKGRVDVSFEGLSPALLPALRQEPALSVESGPGAGVSYLMFNLEDPVLARHQVREAVALALDREALALFKFRGAASPARSLLPPGHWAYDESLPLQPHDLARARALLDEAGFPDPGGGKPRLTLTLTTSTDRFRRSLALAMASQLSEVGIEVAIRALEWGTFMGAVKHGAFQLATLKVTPVIDPDVLRLMLGSESIPSADNGWGGLNRMHYRNPTLDDLLERGRQLSDPAARRAIYARAQAIVVEDMPLLPLFAEDAITVRSAGVVGLAPTPQASFFPLVSARSRR